MFNQGDSIKLRVCNFESKPVDKSIVSALRASHFDTEEHNIDLSHSEVNKTVNYDCLLVDWRDANTEIAEYFCSQAGREPVIALINSEYEPSNPELLVGFNDFVCEQEFKLASFKLRLQVLLRRYKDPITITSTNAPEARLLQSVVNHSSDWLFIKDLDHRFLAVSEEYANSLERSLDAVIGKNDLDIGFSKDVVLGSEKSDWQGFWPQDDYAVQIGEPTIETNPYWRVFTGDTRHRRTTRVPLKNHWGEVYALLICSEDVTAIVKTEQVLKERSEMLEKVTQEKLKADHSRLMAELAITAKNKFIATASHDLRQPLHALGLYLDVLESKLSDKDQQTLISKIKNSSKALSVLFNSLLDLSRLDAGVVEVEPSHFSVVSLLDGLREEFCEVAADKSLSIEFDQCEAVVFTDTVLLERILRNLIQNAITHTTEGCVEVRCFVGKNNLKINIIDTGPGIPQYEQNAIFSEYYQLEHDGRRPTIGLGLGLAIVRRLVDLLEISFELQSESGKGSTFSIELPLGDASLIKSSHPIANKSELTGQTVLIIDDDSDILDGMIHVLDSHGCIPVSALSVTEAIDLLTSKDLVPTAIVADYRLQNGQTGDIAIEIVREEFNTEIPAIIVTGDTSSDRLLEATNSGFRLLHKPVQPIELLAELSNVINQNSPS